MKAICLFLLVTVFPLSARANVAIPLPEPDDTDEAVTIMVGTIVTVGNVMTMVAKSPVYWLGAIGAATGVTALVMSAQPDVVHDSGLITVGLLGLASSAAALRYRYVLNHEASHTRLEPTWIDSSPGLALVLDF
jgi:hypothetical protein